MERWLLAALRKRTFFSLAELNQAIRGLLDRLNNRPFEKLPDSRRYMYESLDKIDYTWNWTATTTRSPTNWWAISWTSATQSARWNASTRASGWPATVASWRKAASPP
ncbi:hypothetical protein DFAR_230002 [Desulfarculales bacterium]